MPCKAFSGNNPPYWEANLQVEAQPPPNAGERRGLHSLSSRARGTSRLVTLTEGSERDFEKRDSMPAADFRSMPLTENGVNALGGSWRGREELSPSPLIW
jgi:hypothetical protein